MSRSAREEVNDGVSGDSCQRWKWNGGVGTERRRRSE